MTGGTEQRSIPGVPRAGAFTTPEAARAAGVGDHSVNRLAERLGRGKGKGAPLVWSWLDVQAMRIAVAVMDAAGGPGFDRVAAAVIREGYAGGEEPQTAGWVAYRQPDTIRYGATPSEALGPLDGAVLAHIPPINEFVRSTT